MNKTYVLDGYAITVVIDKGLVRITNDEALKSVAADQPLTFAERLVDLIRADYQKVYGKTLAISRLSFIVEIDGHLYVEYCLLKYSMLFWVIFPFGLYNRFRRSCEVIDCGERGRDPNRWLWDRLVPLRGWLGRRLAKAKTTN
ncbi:hypothetical protein [Parapedobacter defluvii]|uniref:hypothetical protein n=1 Tax=Parapedobacter defluvii TaxID=2045106 RepID=UPI003341E093